MKNKTMGLMVTVSTLLFCYTAIAHSESAEALFKHREYLKQWVEECKPRPFIKQHVLSFSDIDQKGFGFWKENKNQIRNVFVELCQEQVRRNLNCSPQRNYGYLDSVQLNILFNMLSDLPHEMDEQIIRLLRLVPHPHLNKHRAMVINILKKGDNINRFSYLAAVIDPPADMKKTLLASDKLSVGLRARLGDKKIEEELIQKVNNYTGDKRIGKLIEDLFLCGTNECLKVAFELFVKYEPAMNKTGDCALGKDRDNPAPFFRNSIIGQFIMYYPELSLLQKYRGHGFGANWDMIVNYMEEIVKWGNAEYGTNAKLDNWFLFPGQCEPVASRERSVREFKANPRHDSLMRVNPGYRKGFSDKERELDSLKRARSKKQLSN